MFSLAYKAISSPGVTEGRTTRWISRGQDCQEDHDQVTLGKIENFLPHTELPLTQSWIFGLDLG